MEHKKVCGSYFAIYEPQSSLLLKYDPQKCSVTFYFLKTLYKYEEAFSHSMEVLSSIRLVCNGIAVCYTCYLANQTDEPKIIFR